MEIGNRRVPFLVRLLVVCAILFGVYQFWAKDYFLSSGAAPKGSVTPTDVKLADQPATPSTSFRPKEAPLPSDRPVAEAGDKDLIRMAVPKWNSQMGLIDANGGVITTKGSFMDNEDVKLHLKNQDDFTQAGHDLQAFANELYEGNAQPTSGVHFVCFMGDYGAAYLHDINGQLERLGSDYMAEMIGSPGRSEGEDKFMGQPEWETDPQKARGSVIIGVVRDGDWNCLIKWAGANKVPYNPDDGTYDANAINFYNAKDFLDAPRRYNAGQTVTLKEKKNGKLTGEPVQKQFDGVVTWFPGDQMVVKGKGGLITLASTADYIYQMPNIIIGIKKWNADNKDKVVGMLRAMMNGGDQVKFYPQTALKFAADISSKLYQYEDPGQNQGAEYWRKGYLGYDETDKSGLTVHIGGSRVHNLADNIYLFGLNGGTNIYQISYETFGNYVKDIYPKDLPSYYPVDQVLNLTYLQEVARGAGTIAAASKPKFTENAPITQTVAKTDWNIQFEFGSARLSSDATRDLEKIYRDLLTAGALYVEVQGHTDDIGGRRTNMELSDARAQAVKQWLQNRDEQNFPAKRMTTTAYGPDRPKVPNTSESNRAQNRRVTIVQGRSQ